MQILALIPSFLLFLYTLYKLVKDDYVFIRRNISLEEVFDITFASVLICLFFSRLLFLISQKLNWGFSLVSFFSPSMPGFSLTGGVIGGILAIYFIGKYKKVPLGRLFDFFTLAFLISLPVGYLFLSAFLKREEVIIYFLQALLYALVALFFSRILLGRLMRRTLREGNLSILFLLFFSLMSFFTSMINKRFEFNQLHSIQNILLGILFIFSLFLLFRQERDSFGNRKNNFKR